MLVLDELGKMESYSKPFLDAVSGWLHDPGRSGILLATIPIARGKPLSIVEAVQKLSGTKILTVTRENREQLVKHVKDLVLNALSIAK